MNHSAQKETARRILRIATALRMHGFHDSRIIAGSKTFYVRQHPDHFVVFNAQLYTRLGRIFKQADFDLSQDGDKLAEVAREVDENFYILYENDPTPFWSGRKLSVRQLALLAPWWTRIKPKDQDLFSPISGKRRIAGIQNFDFHAGSWNCRRAYYVCLRHHSRLQARNLYGSAVLLKDKIQREPNIVKKISGKLIGSTQPVGRGERVHPLCYHRSGELEYVWFSNNLALPAKLFDFCFGHISSLRFTHDSRNGVIAVWEAQKLIGKIHSTGWAPMQMKVAFEQWLRVGGFASSL